MTPIRYNKSPAQFATSTSTTIIPMMRGMMRSRRTDLKTVTVKMKILKQGELRTPEEKRMGNQTTSKTPMGPLVSCVPVLMMGAARAVQVQHADGTLYNPKPMR